MGIKLVEYFERAVKIGGIKSRMKLATLTLISSDKARNIPEYKWKLLHQDIQEPGDT